MRIRITLLCHKHTETQKEIALQKRFDSMDQYLDDVVPDTPAGRAKLEEYEEISGYLEDAKRAVEELEKRTPRFQLAEPPPRTLEEIDDHIKEAEKLMKNAYPADVQTHSGLRKGLQAAAVNPTPPPPREPDVLTLAAFFPIVLDDGDRDCTHFRLPEGEWWKMHIPKGSYESLLWVDKETWLAQLWSSTKAVPRPLTSSVFVTFTNGRAHG